MQSNRDASERLQARLILCETFCWAIFQRFYVFFFMDGVCIYGSTCFRILIPDLHRSLGAYSRTHEWHGKAMMMIGVQRCLTKDEITPGRFGVPVWDIQAPPS